MFLQDKVILVTGIASQRSIAFGIARQLSLAGARLILACQNEKLASRVKDFSSELTVEKVVICDATLEKDVQSLADLIEKEYSTLDGFVHAIAYAPADQLKGLFHEVIDLNGFHVAHEVSSYSFCLMAKYLSSLLIKSRGSLVTLSYLGAERSVPNYNVMGMAKASLEASVRYLASSLGEHQVRVNAISAGPVKTLAASGIAGFKDMLKNCADQSVLKRNVQLDEIGKTAVFLLSDFSSAITAEVLYVDCGFSKTAMNFTS